MKPFYLWRRRPIDLARGRPKRRVVEVQHKREWPSPANGQPVSGLGLGGNANGEVSRRLSQNLGGPKAITIRGIGYRPSFDVGQSQCPVPRLRHVRADLISAPAIEQ